MSTTDALMLQIATAAEASWLGGYEPVAVVDDGDILCWQCVRDNREQIEESTTEHAHDGWQVIGFMSTGDLDEPDCCGHCYRTLA